MRAQVFGIRLSCRSCCGLQPSCPSSYTDPQWYMHMVYHALNTVHGSKTLLSAASRHELQHVDTDLQHCVG
jgi:hypothetical protein